MLSTLIALLILLAVVGIAWWAIQQMSLPQPFRIIAVVVVAVLAIVVLLNYLPGAGGLHLN